MTEELRAGETPLTPCMSYADLLATPGGVLAPMAGFTDRAMRCLCHRYGAQYTVTEMVSARAVVYGDRKTRTLARIRADEGPVVLQLFGSEPDIIAEAAARILSTVEPDCVPPVGIDINMGCPVSKIFSNGEGSALMRDPERIYRIVAATVASVPLPVSVKLRAGVDDQHRNAVVCAQAAEAAGASLVAVHGRTRVAMYGGKADMEIVRDVKRALHIPVLESGDAVSAETAHSILQQTGADGVMIGRGAIGEPFLFAALRAELSGASYRPPSWQERCQAALEQLALAVEDKGERVAVAEARKQIALYFRGFRGCAAFRGAMNQATTYAQAEALVARLYDEAMRDAAAGDGGESTHPADASVSE